jgi:hypothetical protein
MSLRDAGEELMAGMCVACVVGTPHQVDYRGGWARSANLWESDDRATLDSETAVRSLP